MLQNPLAGKESPAFFAWDDGKWPRVVKYDGEKCEDVTVTIGSKAEAKPSEPVAASAHDRRHPDHPLPVGSLHLEREEKP